MFVGDHLASGAQTLTPEPRIFNEDTVAHRAKFAIRRYQKGKGASWIRSGH